MNGLTETKAKLLADPSVVSSVSTYKTKPAIFGKPVVPEKVSGNAISMYLSVPVDGGLEYGNFGLTVNCWASKYDKCIDIQEAVYNALNRQTYAGNTFFLCIKSVVIPSTTVGGGEYNAPVEVLVRQR